MGLTSNEVLLQQGDDARRLLQDAVFMRTVNRLVDRFTTSLLHTQPHDKEGREAMYFAASALQAIVDTLAQDVQVAEEIRDIQQEVINADNE